MKKAGTGWLLFFGAVGFIFLAKFSLEHQAVNVSEFALFVLAALVVFVGMAGL
jgi:hypothetical protein